jgi:hypothetical protein
MKKFTIAWYQANPAYVKEQNEKYDKKYPAHWYRKGDDKNYWRTKLAAHKHRAKKLNRLPPRWADEAKIEQIFRNCPPGKTLDHVIPLQGENVCGLEVENNFQYLSLKENCKKNNTFRSRISVRIYAVISLI